MKKVHGKSYRKQTNLFKFRLFNKKKRPYESRLNRVYSPWRMRLAPIISVLLGSLMTTLPFFTYQPLLPPFGFMVFIAWRFMRPGIWPMWAGLPLGLFDDIFSGALFGTAAFTWSLAMLVAEFIDSRIIWRDHIIDWIIAGFFITVYLLSGILLIGLVQPSIHIIVILPQILFSILLYPLIVRYCAVFDKWRLKR